MWGGLNKKRVIVYDRYTEAAKIANAVLGEFLEYSPECIQLDDFSKISDRSILYIGKSGVFPAVQGGYRIKAFQNEFGNDVIELIADDEINLLYAAVDFKNVYIPKLKYSGIYAPVNARRPFSFPVLEFDEVFSPSIKNRGIWTWGYVIYNYKKFIDNMLALKLNTLTIWNDYVPINASEIIEYAHRYGIKVFFGYAWGWDTSFSEIPDLDSLSDSIFYEYEKSYSHLDLDGIYFQSFTEVRSDNIGGVDVAENVVNLVNRAAGRLLSKYPDLVLQFGLHATSVKNRLDIISKVDPRVAIIWEDCGAAPYSYMFNDNNNFEETLEFTKKAVNLREADFGAVLKGMPHINWSCFEHQDGPFILGECDEKLNSLIEEKKDIWKISQAALLKNAENIFKIIKQFGENSYITMLVENSGFEAGLWYPVAVLSEMLWDTNQSVSEALEKAALIPDSLFA